MNFSWFVQQTEEWFSNVSNNWHIFPGRFFSNFKKLFQVWKKYFFIYRALVGARLIWLICNRQDRYAGVVIWFNIYHPLFSILKAIFGHFWPILLKLALCQEHDMQKYLPDHQKFFLAFFGVLGQNRHFCKFFKFFFTNGWYVHVPPSWIVTYRSPSC